MYTDLAKEKMHFINDFYPELKKFYQPMLGNFCFDSEELSINIDLIKGWLKDQKDYFLIFEDNYYYLTDFRD